MEYLLSPLSLFLCGGVSSARCNCSSILSCFNVDTSAYKRNYKTVSFELVCPPDILYVESFISPYPYAAFIATTRFFQSAHALLPLTLVNMSLVGNYSFCKYMCVLCLTSCYSSTGVVPSLDEKNYLLAITIT